MATIYMYFIYKINAFPLYVPVPDGPMIAISSVGLKYAEIPLRIVFFVFSRWQLLL